jgi:hypothetical protein
MILRFLSPCGRGVAMSLSNGRGEVNLYQYLRFGRNILRPCFDFLEAIIARIYTGGNDADNGANKGPTAKHEQRFK